jgi:DNA-binding protein YbaB
VADLLVAAIREATRTAAELQQEKMGPLTQMPGMPGLPGF